ncbi:MerR family transcriptional regulator [Peribacillus sp. SCS-155]|uniref:MerR family transcriptional regulator n=1 Tax=Peribacillus sedimenti TaxID=3115297 RepID=UPI0039060060
MLQEGREWFGKYYRIGDLAKQMDISKRTVDYYTKLGLLIPVRNDSNYRLYGEEAIRILELIIHYKKLNMPLQEIKETIDLLHSCDVMNEEKFEKHCTQILEVMHHLEEELRELKPLFEKLNSQQKELLLQRMSSKGLGLAKSLQILLN